MRIQKMKKLLRIVRVWSDFIRPGSVLLSHVLRRSTIAAEDFRFPVRDGWSVLFFAMTTKPNKIRQMI